MVKVVFCRNRELVLLQVRERRRSHPGAAGSPVIACFSSSATDRPILAAARAAATPETPAPATTSSYSFLKTAIPILPQKLPVPEFAQNVACKTEYVNRSPRFCSVSREERKRRHCKNSRRAFWRSIGNSSALLWAVLSRARRQHSLPPARQAPANGSCYLIRTHHTGTETSVPAAPRLVQMYLCQSSGAGAAERQRRTWTWRPSAALTQATVLTQPDSENPFTANTSTICRRGCSYPSRPRRSFCRPRWRCRGR